MFNLGFVIAGLISNLLKFVGSHSTDYKALGIKACFWKLKLCM